MGKRKVLPVIIDNTYSTGEPFERLPVDADRRDSFIITMYRLSAMNGDEKAHVPIQAIYDEWYAYYVRESKEDTLETLRCEGWLTQPQVAGQAIREIIKGAEENPEIWIRRRSKNVGLRMTHEAFTTFLFHYGETLWDDVFPKNCSYQEKQKIIVRNIASLMASPAQVSHLEGLTDIKAEFHWNPIHGIR